MKKISAIVLLAVAFPVIAFAGMPERIKVAVYSSYVPAIEHRGLETAYEQLETSKLRGFVVIEKGGIPVEQARFFIEWQEYDYRGAVVRFDRQESVTTRRGAPFAYLEKGEVMAVAGIETYGRTVYLKLISPDIYERGGEKAGKHHSRVTVQLGFELPKDVVKNDDADTALRLMSSWVRPFSDSDAAVKYATTLTGESEASKASKASKENDRLKELEQKIDAAKQQMEEAEKELQDIKSKKTP